VIGPLSATLRRLLPRDCLVVLAFHRVGESLPPWHFGIEPDRLERVVTTFARIATPVTLGEVAERGIRGRMLALTFDDGFADNAEVAAPLLSRLGVPAAFFVTAACVESGRAPWPDEAYARLLSLPGERLRRFALRLAPGWPVRGSLAAAHAAVHGLKGMDPAGRDRVMRVLPPAGSDPGRMMTLEQVRGLTEQGFEVGSHGMTHAPLTGVDDAQLRWELTESRRVLENALGRSCDLIAYPDNRADERVAAAAAAAGYRLALRGGERVNEPGVDLLVLSRLSGEDRRLWAIAGRATFGVRSRLSFTQEAERYGDQREEEFSFRTQADIVERTLAAMRPRRVLDAGCGAGALVPWLERAGVTDAVGIDAAPEMVAEARRRYPRHRWQRSDLRRLPFPSHSFDAVASLGVLEYVDEPRAVVRELARVARPGAPVVLSVPQRGSPNAMASRLYELLRGGLREGSRPLRRNELIRVAAGAALELRGVRSTNFFAFPVTAVAPRLSWRMAAGLDGLGRVPGARKLGAQLVVEARKPDVLPLYWLAPALPTNTTFLDRELAALRRAGATVVPLVPPRVGGGALVGFLRRPLRALAVAAELQRHKAKRDKERGRLGYVVLFLRGLALAEQLEDKPGRLHATFADGVGTIAYVVHMLTGRAYSFTVHSPYSLWQGSQLLAHQAGAADVVVCEAPAIAGRLRELAPDARIEVVPAPGPDAAGPRGSVNPGLVLCVGRLIAHKGFATAIEAIGIAVQAGVEVRLEIHGDGPEQPALERLVLERGLADRVVLIGTSPNETVIERLGVALCMLAPCEVQPDGDRDGLPVSIVDAAWCGTPVIATAVSSIPDLVVDEETGLLVPERDPRALAGAIERLACDPLLASRLGAEAQRRAVMLHDPAAGAERLLRIWGDVDRHSAVTRPGSVARSAATNSAIPRS
jgi:glycosyltransferase involved in cell wall biosynthesis/peptidoglycan/xylan/chitin deacetylase (PgdA/CDA1 family)